MLPNFLCIGAQKSGTTTLLRQLARHPSIFMSPARETRFFLLDNLYAQGVGAYELEYFSDWNGEKATGEKTPEYLCDPEVPSRIHASLGPSVKLVVTFRSPAQRAYAHYRHNFQQLWEDVEFEQALQLEESRCQAGRHTRLMYGYLWRGYYAEQLQRYSALFPPQGFFFAVYEQDIVAQQTHTLQRLFAFLQVDSGFDPGDSVSAGRAQPMIPTVFKEPAQVAIGDKHLQAKAGDILFSREGIKPRLIRAPSKALRIRADAALAHMPREISLPRDLELQINRQYFSDDIRRLEKLIGRDLSMWLD